ncbi:hypothetical protein RDWZM_008073 [Blomia tropicalis]|uniref:ESF1-like protein n=1 Tax=Blomia tropicalis TaxID=40697 RepID=A0A9Q0M0T6_BLOTA|nr:pre-rRNA-processing protein esf1 [Blomia tropicalis]KAJ6216916.1 hypothetical protein RDWZM_008073 [Blomia tropicalis]
MAEQDERFAKVFSDPRFRTLRKTDKTLKIDNRFKSMFTEDKFKLKYSMDKRGKSKKHLISEDYKKFYRLSDDENGKEIDSQSNDEGEPEKNDDGNECKPIIKLTHKYGYHRGKVNDDDIDESSSSSSSSDSEVSEEEEDEEVEHGWGELDKDVEQIDHVTNRIAICNADWDRVNAQDIFVLLNSFKRATGAIHFVRIFYSKFGEERLQVEEEKGPSEFIFGKANIVDKLENESDNNEEDEKEEDENLDENDLNSDDDDDEESSKSESMEKLRKYQLERLKYFYAVIEFDSTETAELIYNELDGMEYESSSTTLDIRFIPDDMNFDDVKLKEECSSMPNSNYQAPAFINTALQQSKVKLTWDENDPKRKNLFNEAFEKDNEDDLKAYLASDDDNEFSSGDDEQIEFNSNMKEDEKINKYKDLLKSLDNSKDDDIEMEVTWDPCLKSSTSDIITNKKDSISNEMASKTSIENKIEDSKKCDNLKMNDLLTDSDNEQAEVKRVNVKSKRQKRKNAKLKVNLLNETTKGDASNLELLMVDIDNHQGKKHFNYKQIVDDYSKKNSMSDDNAQNDSFKFNADDSRFAAIYTSHLYNIDQSDPSFKRTKAFDQILNKQKIKASQLINEESIKSKKRKLK